MELETEIPIWFNGKVKWISNLSCDSTCSDIIKSILLSSSLDSDSSCSYILYESWHGIERPLKYSCRLLKLWKSWGNESENVILTLKHFDEQRILKYIFIKKQNKKLNKLKKKIKLINQEINQFNIYQSIYYLNKQIEKENKIIFNLKLNIKKEFNQKNLNLILFHINQTFFLNQKLIQKSNQINQLIKQINKSIQSKIILLNYFKLNQHLNLPRTNIIPIQTLSIETRPISIVESTSSSPIKRKESLSKSFLRNDKIEFVPFSIYQTCQFQSSINDESDTGISSMYSNDEQLMTLV